MEAGVTSKQNLPGKDTGDNSVQEKADAGDKSLWNPLGLLNDAAKSVADSFSDALPEDFPTLEVLGFSPVETNSAKALKTAQAGSVIARSQADKYFAFRDSNHSHAETGKEHLQEGSYKNENGSSYEIDSRGDFRKLQMPPSEKFPNGLEYTGTYNDKHELIAMKVSDGRTFTRISQANEKGFAYWECKDAKGQKIRYSASDLFVGKISMDKDGIQTMIDYDRRNPKLNTHLAGTLYFRSSDGTEVRTKILSTKGRSDQLEGTSFLTDGTEATTKFKLDANKQFREDGITVKSADGDWNGTVKDGKISTLQENLLAKARLTQMAGNLDNNPQLQNIRYATIQDRGNSVHAEISNYRSVHKQSMRPGTVINGIRADGTTISNNLKFDLYHNDNSLHFDNINGMTGHGSKLGPLRIKRWHGKSPVDELVLGPGYMKSHTNKGWMKADSRHLNNDGLNMVRSGFISQADTVLDMIQANTDQIAACRTSQRSFDINLTPEKKYQEKSKEGERRLECSKNVRAQFSYSEKGHKLSNIQGVSFLGQSVSEIRTEPDKGGQLKISVDYIDPETREKGTISFSESQARSALAMIQQKKR